MTLPATDQVRAGAGAGAGGGAAGGVFTGGRVGALGVLPPQANRAAQAIAPDRSRDLDAFTAVDRLYQLERAAVNGAAPTDLLQRRYRDVTARLRSRLVQCSASHLNPQREPRVSPLIDELIAAAAFRAGQRTATRRSQCVSED
jgi:hypothetical protein